MLRTAISVAALILVTAAAQAQTLERIEETQTLKIGFRTDAPPLSYADDEGRPSGFSPILCGQIAQAIANVLQLEELQADFIAVTAENRFDMVESGEIDLLCGAATITMTRRDQVDFSIPTFVDGAAAMLPAGAEANFGALEGQRVGVRAGTTTQEALANTLAATGLEFETVTYDNHADGMDAMAEGDLAAYFADQSILMFLRASSAEGQNFNVMDRLLTVETQGLAMQRGDDEFRHLVDGVISGLYANGTMEQIYREALPGVEPGQALRALYLIAPILP